MKSKIDERIETEEVQLSKMVWIKGCTSPNPSGRPKGAKNKFSKSIIEGIQKAYNLELSIQSSEFENLEPINKIKILKILVKYILYKKRKIEKELKNNKTC